MEVTYSSICLYNMYVRCILITSITMVVIRICGINAVVMKHIVLTGVVRMKHIVILEAAVVMVGIAVAAVLIRGRPTS